MRDGEHTLRFGLRRRADRAAGRMARIDGDRQSLERTREADVRRTAQPEHETAPRIEQHEIAVRRLRQLHA